MPLSTELHDTYRTRELMEALLADPRQLGPDFQPIHSLTGGNLIGYKATGRGATGTELADTLALLDGARTLGFVERIDWAFRALAVEDMLPRPWLELHLTPEPETFGTPVAPRFAGLMARANRELTIAAEFHAEAFAPGARLDAGLAEAREWGWKIVLADVSDDADALAKAASIDPDIVQIDLRRAGRDQDHGVQALLDIAGAAQAQIMALGVDVPSALERAQLMDATLVRGNLFGHPGPLPGA
ncbi:MAG: EAL domain-containing protein [Frankiaceae bacterium]|nr:EAL domain-containing protein [Frankiaceae bacterium]